MEAIEGAIVRYALDSFWLIWAGLLPAETATITKLRTDNDILGLANFHCATRAGAVVLFALDQD